jgi:hypothetical protein
MCFELVVVTSACNLHSTPPYSSPFIALTIQGLTYQSRTVNNEDPHYVITCHVWMFSKHSVFKQKFWKHTKQVKKWYILLRHNSSHSFQEYMHMTSTLSVCMFLRWFNHWTQLSLLLARISQNLKSRYTGSFFNFCAMSPLVLYH